MLRIFMLPENITELMGCSFQSGEDVPGEKPDLPKGEISQNSAGVDKDENGKNAAIMNCRRAA